MTNAATNGQTTQQPTHELRAPLGGRFKSPEDVIAMFAKLGATVIVTKSEAGWVHFQLDDNSTALAGLSPEEVSEQLMQGNISPTQAIKSTQKKK